MLLQLLFCFVISDNAFGLNQTIDDVEANHKKNQAWQDGPVDPVIIVPGVLWNFNEFQVQIEL